MQQWAAALTQINEEAQTLLGHLRDEKVPHVLRSQNIRRRWAANIKDFWQSLMLLIFSSVEWAGRDGMDARIHADYLRKFLSDFYTSITDMVDAAIRKHAQYRDAFFAEVLHHLYNGKQQTGKW